MFAFEKLIVYQKAVDFADAVCVQAEGNGRFTKPDRRHFFGIARGSVQECVPQLELARRRGLLKSDNQIALKAQLEEIARMLSGLIDREDSPSE
jgi:four helix bundle protein